MFQKHTYGTATGGLYEKPGVTGYYRIWEIANSRYIDEDHYVPYLEWIGLGNTPEVIDITPPVVEQVDNITLDERISALESAFLDDLLTRI
jgi:hypothetical protein